MSALIASFSLPWGFYVILGLLLGALLWSASFRTEADALLATLMGLHSKKKARHDTARNT